MAAAEHLRLLREAVDGPLTLGELSARLGEDGFALLVVFLCLPFLQPIPLGGLSTLVGAYLALAGLRHAAGRRSTWMPGWVARRRIEEKTLRAVLTLAQRLFALVERFSRPRLVALARRHELAGLVIAGLALILLLPLPVPFSNMICGTGMTLLALGHLEEDGLLSCGGLLCALAALAYHAALAVSAFALLASSAAAMETGAVRRALGAGTWNERVHAVHAAGETGAEDVELLRYASEDADWQVRQTAAHFLGRAKAAPELGSILRHEPCRVVRLTALHWLGAMGPSGESVLREVLSGPWETGSRQGCLSSPGSGRAPWAGSPAGAAPADEESELHEEVLTREPTILSTPVAAPRAVSAPAPEPLPKQQAEELDALLGPGFARTDPDGLPAGYLDDKGKLKRDTLPELLALLQDHDPRLRARAADELGKRGPSVARESVAPLTRLLLDKDRRVAASAALALGNMGPAADPAVPALYRLLERGPEDVESSAALALGRIGTLRARKAFARHAGGAAPDPAAPPRRRP